jgi:hypothetical protein
MEATMEWILLVLLVPAVIVPVVLLFGFAGCAQLLGLDDVAYVTPHVEPPTDLKATPKSAHEIDLTWSHPDTVNFDVYQVKGTTSPGNPKDESQDRVANDRTTKDYTASGLEANTEYTFMVTAVYPGVAREKSQDARARTFPATADLLLSVTYGGTYGGKNEAKLRPNEIGRVEFLVWFDGVSVGPPNLTLKQGSLSTPPDDYLGVVTPSSFFPGVTAVGNLHLPSGTQTGTWKVTLPKVVLPKAAVVVKVQCQVFTSSDASTATYGLGKDVTLSVTEGQQAHFDFHVMAFPKSVEP